MIKSKGSILKQTLGHIRDLIIVVIIGNVISFIFSMSLDDFWARAWLNSLYSLFIGSVLWKGNQFIGHYLGLKFDYKTNPARALWWNLFIMFTYTIIAIVVVNYIWFVVIYDWTVEQLFSRSLLTMLIELFVTVAITFIFFSMEFFRAWRESAVNEERLQKESIRLQYQALKNQVNPHFLFNSLNSLTSLVYQDQDQAAKFIKQLSEVYRYVLTHKDIELVRLSDELEFSNRYIFLQQIRLGENLQVNFNIENNLNLFIVPVSLQILLENAIKHNEASDENPLVIDITRNENTLSIRNNLQLKKALKDSGGIGLSTIKARYSFLADQEVRTIQTDDYFQVDIPLINNMEHESPDH